LCHWTIEAGATIMLTYRALSIWTVLYVIGMSGNYATASEVEELTAKAMAHAKSFHGLVVLIDFVDQPANVSLSRADNIINGVGYTEPTVTRSLGDYWYEQSRGKIVLTHEVIGYFRAPQTAAWYDTQPFEAYIILLRQALDWVVATNPSYDWDALSLANGAMNRNGTEEGTFLSVAFMTTAWIPGTGGTHWLTEWTAPNGVSTQQIVGATFISPWDSNVNLFWLTHEQGHSIWGWPDTYDTTGNSHGTGLYSLMSGNQSTGDIEPVGALFLSAERWVRTKEIRRNQTINLEPDGDAVARYKNPDDPREYFLIEARTNSAIGNSAFPAPLGLLIWHVDENVATGNTLPQMTPAEHYFVSVEQADGLFDLELNINTGDFGDVYLPGLAFDELSTPNSNWWDGSPSRLRIDHVRFLRNNRIRFRASTR
jgi:M6 family metalloprotease-like protein